ncbi:MAG: FAD-dependent oxidoreductase, partial [Candidatus Dormiibacterota bacterium]
MSHAAAGLNLTGLARTPGAQRSWWLREALAREDHDARPPLAGDVNADVAIVGGGFTGLWTAYFLTQANPGLGVAVVEQDICGGGPSGRNGGFASGWWDELHGLVELYGPEGAVMACRAISDSITAIGQFCDGNRVDAWFKTAGYMYAVTAAAHEPTCKAMVDLAREVGAPDELRELTQAEVRARCASPAFLAGAFMRDAASVQPGFLVRGLRRVVLERGVRIFEGTPVTGLKAGPPAILTTPNGSLRARNVVLALNAWATGWPKLSRRLVAWSSYIVLT